jgi:hypothetical protein
MNGFAFIAASTFTAVLAANWPAAGTVTAADATMVAVPPSPVAITADWGTRDCGAFRIAAPDETAVRRTGHLSGTLNDRRFTLRYVVTERDANPAAEGQDYREVAITVGGKPALLRTAEFPGTAEPYFLSLTVPHAVKAKNGHWQALEIHGRFANRDRRWLGTYIVRSVDFASVANRNV